MNVSAPPAKSGIQYFMDGFSLIKQPGLRRFVVVPLLCNLVLFAGALMLAINYLSQLMQSVDASVPSWLDWISFLLWPLLIIAILIVFSFIFSAIMNWIAAPFNGLLAEKVEQLLTGKPLYTGGAMDAVKDLPRVFGREWQKLKYYLPRALLVLILFFIPVVGQTVFPVVWFIFSAWMMAIQYCDYPFDNHKVTFADMKQALLRTRGSSMSFGVAVTLFSMVPIVNFIVMPVAICGATAMWVDKYREVYRNNRIAPE
ncbi:sulfate transporter CysZ [Shewanella sp.]|uniref:sulfate transporter CysZ n=1 Tax=Shewanella sp. TaxID=50422 RepID=UPI003A96CF62